jgi:hypothetical protein
MALLVERRIVEVVDAGIGIYAMDYTWRLVH